MFLLEDGPNIIFERTSEAEGTTAAFSTWAESNPPFVDKTFGNPAKVAE